MNNVELYKSLYGEEYVAITNEDGSITSMTKQRWDELQAKQAEGGLI